MGNHTAHHCWAGISLYKQEHPGLQRHAWVENGGKSELSPLIYLHLSYKSKDVYLPFSGTQIHICHAKCVARVMDSSPFFSRRVGSLKMQGMGKQTNSSIVIQSHGYYSSLSCSSSLAGLFTFAIHWISCLPSHLSPGVGRGPRQDPAADSCSHPTRIPSDLKETGTVEAPLHAQEL